MTQRQDRVTGCNAFSRRGFPREPPLRTAALEGAGHGGWRPGLQAVGTQEASRGLDPVARLQVTVTCVPKQWDPRFRQNLTQNVTCREMKGWRSWRGTDGPRLLRLLPGSSQGTSEGSRQPREPTIQPEEKKSRHVRCPPQTPTPRRRHLPPLPCGECTRQGDVAPPSHRPWSRILPPARAESRRNGNGAVMKNKRSSRLHLQKAGKEVGPNTQKWLFSTEREKSDLSRAGICTPCKGTGFPKCADVWVTFKT